MKKISDISKIVIELRRDKVAEIFNKILNFSDLSNSWQCNICNTFNIKSVDECHICSINKEKISTEVEERENTETGLTLSHSPLTTTINQIIYDISGNIDRSEIEKITEQSLNYKDWEYIEENN